MVDEENSEKMTHKDAAMFPVYLSGYLFGLYLLFKIIDPLLVSFILSLFFSFMGVNRLFISYINKYGNLYI